jgi:enamine deaminase RidA (YjgF/YER057c/UK114 family)
MLTYQSTENSLSFRRNVVSAGGWVFSSLQLPTDWLTGMVPEAAGNARAPFGSSQIERETRVILHDLAKTMDVVGCDVRRDLLRIYWWLASDYPTLQDFEQGNLWPRIVDISGGHVARDERIDDPQPATTGIGVRKHLLPSAVMGVDAIGVDPASGHVKRVVESADAGDLDGRPSAVRCGDWVFTTQVPTDWRGDFMSDRHMGEPGLRAPQARANPYVWFNVEVELQLDYTLERLARIAEAAGSRLDRCVKAEVYIGHPSDLYALNRAWRRWFPDRQPARVVVPYAGLGGRGWRVEIGMQLLADDADCEIETIETSAAPEPLGPEPQAVRAGELVFLSTQLPVDSAGEVPKNLLPASELPYFGLARRRQAEFMLANISAICDAAGSSLERVCRRHAFYRDLAEFAEINDGWSEHFGSLPPASTDVQVGRPGWPMIAPDAAMLMDVIAHAPPATQDDLAPATRP